MYYSKATLRNVSMSLQLLISCMHKLQTDIRTDKLFVEM